MSQFAQELLDAMPTPGARLAALNVLAKWAGCSVYVPVHSETERREHAAEHMLRNAMDRGEVVTALRERFRVSERTAWRTVAKAQRNLSGGDGTDG